VAASGEEGTLPRGRAWAMFAASIVALVLVVVARASVALNNAVPMRSPDAQLNTARELLKSVGHEAPPRDSIWWMTADRAYLEELPTRGTTRTLFDLPAHDVPGPVRFCYRQSPRPIFSTAFPYATADEFFYTEPEPAMRWYGEAYVELDSSGRLVQLRILPGQQRSAGTAIPDWNLLLRAARCDPLHLSETTPSLLPPDRYDVAAEWAGNCDGRQVQVSAAAVGGGGKPNGFGRSRARRLFLAVVSALGGAQVESLADLLRTFNHQSGVQVAYKAFYHRPARNGFDAFMHEMGTRLIKPLRVQTLTPDGEAAVARLYRLRWQIGLCVKEWKSYANLHRFDIANPPIAAGLIWASPCAAILRRRDPGVAGGDWRTPWRRFPSTAAVGARYTGAECPGYSS